MGFDDAGLATDHWKKFYTPEEIEEVVRVTSTTTIVSAGYPIHVRVFTQPHPAPTVVMAHPMLIYGLLLARLQLPFHRAGFNVVQWDLPGWGQSGGPRAGCPVNEFIDVWRDSLEFAHARFGGPLFTMGLAEDSVTCYYATANHPWVNAMSLHNLHEYGDPGGLNWLGPHWWIRVKTLALRFIALLAPTMGTKAEEALPWEAVFSGPDDGPAMQLFAEDPLRVKAFQYRLGASMARPFRPPVRFEDCRTPVQLIVSEKSRLWPADMNMRYFMRIGGPKDLVSLTDSDQWVYTREFMEMYAAHAINWFQKNGAFQDERHHEIPREQERQPVRAAGRLSPDYVAQVGKSRSDQGN